jgi:hypothetical protein
VLSDPPANPIAYHQLATAYLARSTTLWRPSAGTRRLLVRMARGIVAIAAPGDVAYWGRSQEQSWSLVLGAYGLREAARYARRDEAGRFAAVANRLLGRFRARHVGGPYGTYITPSYVADPFTRPGGQDSYASVSTYAGLTAYALSWLAEQPPLLVGAVVPAARTFVMPHGSGSFAVVRTRSTWFAVRRRRAVDDLRSDFGLAAAKTRVGRGWQEVTPIKPLTLTGPDSAGPILRVRGRVGYPDGRAIAVRAGVVRVRGGWRTASGRWLRQATFRYAAAPHGVTVSVRLRRGDRIEYSVFGVAPRVAGRTVVDGPRRTRVSLPAAALVEAGYASGDHRSLTRVRLSMRARRGGLLVVRHRVRLRRRTAAG